MDPSSTGNFWARSKPDTLIAVGILFLVFFGSAGTILDRRAAVNDQPAASNQTIRQPETVETGSLTLREGKFLPERELDNIKAFGSRRMTGPCQGLFEIQFIDGTYCTHGPDSALTLAELSKRPRVNSQIKPIEPVQSVAAASVSCDGDGVSGKRVQNLYVRAADQTDRFNPAGLALIQANTVAINSAIKTSAKKTKGDRNVRFVHNAACEPLIENVVISASTATCPTEGLNGKCIVNITNELMKKGYNKQDRKYLIWLDGNLPGVCGQAFTPAVKDLESDSPGLDNVNNTRNAYAYIYRDCWDNGLQPGRGLHELTHVLGAVQLSAPSSDKNGHCYDGEDVLCNSLDLAPNYTLRQKCLGFSQFETLDCNNDDYFHTNPPQGSYLFNHWNVASSEFLNNGVNNTGAVCSQGDDFCTPVQPPVQTAACQPPTEIRSARCTNAVGRCRSGCQNTVGQCCTSNYPLINGCCQPGCIVYNSTPNAANKYTNNAGQACSVASVESYGYCQENLAPKGADGRPIPVDPNIPKDPLIYGAAATTTAPNGQPICQPAAAPILFDFDRVIIKPEFQTQLIALAATLKAPENAGKQITLEGHTDPVGTAAYNRSLSLRRAESVKNFLITQGIQATRITTVPQGENKPGATPIASRRVEIFY